MSDKYIYQVLTKHSYLDTQGFFQYEEKEVGTYSTLGAAKGMRTRTINHYHYYGKTNHTYDVVVRCSPIDWTEMSL